MQSRKLFKTFLQNRRGYVAVVFGILALPLVGIAGAAVDYRNIGREYAAIHTAAEAAAAAGARAKFKQDLSGGAETPEDLNVLIPAVFNSNYPNNENKVLNIDIDQTLDVGNKTLSVHVTADARTSLLQVIGFSSFPISVTAKAAAVFSDKNVEVHFVFDMTPSMGAPDNGDAPPLTAGTTGSDGCFFMCHDDGSTMRAASLKPKMDTIINALADKTGAYADGRGFVKALGDAATQNPIAITMKFSGHYFDHHFHNTAYFSITDAATTITKLGDMLTAGPTHYYLGQDGVNGGTDLKTSFDELNTYLNSTYPPPGNTRRVIIIISDGMHARAIAPFDPAVCTSLRSRGDVFTVYVKNPEAVYRNPNLSYVISGGPDINTQAVDTWDWNALINGGGDSPYGYYSGLNNAELLMRNCASKSAWAYMAETGTEIYETFENMAEVITSPTIRVIN